ncbi:MAG TPA: ABC transporter substrate-binding protein [Actinomycetaceae bacterium]|nr:ABC transporter substrate-binding protein [Actinomycetaceae bacterium]
MTKTRAARSIAAITVSLVLAGCASSPDGDSPEMAGATGDSGRTTYPLTIENCDVQVTFEKAPERVILLETAPVTILDGIGVLDRVVSRAGTFSPEYYDDDINQQLDSIPMLSDEIDASGHLMINAEVVLAQTPDLALGLPDGLTREGLLDGGANTLIQPIYCPSGVGDTTFETLYDQIAVYGQIFDRNAEAEELITNLQQRVTAVEELTAESTDRTAAVLYPSVGGGPLYAYGRASMAQPQLEAAGFENVFADSADRVFEVSIEELLGRNPDALILLYQDDETGIVNEITSLPGSDALQAIQNDDVLVQLFNFTEPPTPLSVTGLERIIERFGSGS